MRHRQDFYTLCPSCETRIEMTLAANLQAARAGSSCRCHSCHHEWVCIQEWIYRREPVDSSQTVLPSTVSAPAPVEQVSEQPAQTQFAPMQPPRPHLPTFQPKQPIQTPAAINQSGIAGTAPVSPGPGHSEPAEQPAASKIPAPHAWSFERQSQTQPASRPGFQPGQDR